MLNVASWRESSPRELVVMLFSMHSTDGKINGNSIDANPRQKLDFNHIGLTYNTSIIWTDQLQKWQNV